MGKSSQDNLTVNYYSWRVWYVVKRGVIVSDGFAQNSIKITF